MTVTLAVFLRKNNIFKHFVPRGVRTSKLDSRSRWRSPGYWRTHPHGTRDSAVAGLPELHDCTPSSSCPARRRPWTRTARRPRAQCRPHLFYCAQSASPTAAKLLCTQFIVFIIVVVNFSVALRTPDPKTQGPTFPRKSLLKFLQYFWFFLNQ